MKDIRIEQDWEEPYTVQISFAEGSSIYSPCFSPSEFEYLKYCVHDLANHYGEIEYCPNHADVNPERAKSGALSLVTADNNEYQIQLVDGTLWAQIDFTKDEWLKFVEILDNFPLKTVRVEKEK